MLEQGFVVFHSGENLNNSVEMQTSTREEHGRMHFVTAET